jgi:hypothetical protein
LNKGIILAIALGVIAFSIPFIYVVAVPVDPLDNAGRREYVYCPVNPSLLSSRTTYEINGCPSVRIYVNNWNQLSVLDQTAIDSQLRSAGFKEPSELGNIIR